MSRFSHVTTAALATALLVTAPAAFAQDDASAGLFATARQLPLVSQSLTVDLDGDDATLELVQVFANPGDEIAQADYRLRLPTAAAVTGFGFWRQGRYLAATLAERDAARQEHQNAARAGRTTGLLQSEGTTASFSVYPLLANRLQQVRTTLRLPVERESGRSHLRLPVDRFLGGGSVASSVVVHLASTEPIAAWGVDGATATQLARSPRAVDLALATDQPLDVWWAEEAPPLLARAESVTLDDASLAIQLRLALNDGGTATDTAAAPAGPVVLLVDTSASMRRRARALADLVARATADLARRRPGSPSSLRVVSVGGVAVELDEREPKAILGRLLSGDAGFHSSWQALEAAATDAGCDRGTRCVVVTDPQVDGLPTPDLRRPDLAVLFLADADELVHFAPVLGEAALTYQPDVEPRARLQAAVDLLLLPVLEVLAVSQPAGDLELDMPLPQRVAEGGALRVFAHGHSTAPITLELAIGDRHFTRDVTIEELASDSRQGKALRRGTYAHQLAAWSADYAKSRDAALRQRIVELSLREGIPTDFTALQVSDPAGELPRTATPAPLLRCLGALLLLVGAVAHYWRRREVPAT